MQRPFYAPPSLSTLDAAKLSLVQLFEQLGEPPPSFDLESIALDLVWGEPPGESLAIFAIAPLEIGAVQLRRLRLAAAVVLAAPHHALDEAAGDGLAELERIGRGGARTNTLLDVGTLEPVAQGGVGDPEVLGNLIERNFPFAGNRDNVAAELRGIGSRWFQRVTATMRPCNENAGMDRRRTMAKPRLTKEQKQTALRQLARQPDITLDILGIPPLLCK
jgi:hypothetical protein